MLAAKSGLGHGNENAWMTLDRSVLSPVRRRPGRPKSARENGAGPIGLGEDPQADILRIATEEFVANGLSGARVDAIAERTRTTKAMIYYYFGSKEALYIAVLEKAYSSIRSAEDHAHIAQLPPIDAAKALVEASFDFHWKNPHVGRLISIENINDARYLEQAPQIREQNVSAISAWETVLAAGQKASLFRQDVKPVDMHAFVSSLCVFRVTNRATFKAIFDIDFADQAVRERHRTLIVSMVLEFLCINGQATERD
jgi:AcrR family transcriptional regulator